MGNSVDDLARQLARNAEAVCRCYLSNGRRSGRYWVVGDVMNTPGRSMYVRLTGPEAGKGAAGKWTDASTGEHGDLLDIIGRHHGLSHFPDIAAEAWRFLGTPRECTQLEPRAHSALAQTSAGSPESARRLFAMSKPIAGTIAETYLHGRGITALHEIGSLRFHPCCYYRPHPESSPEAWPAMIAAITDLDGTMTGVHRTWLDPSGHDKASVDTPRRAMGHLLGNGVRFGTSSDVMAAGEGIETMLSLRCVLPSLPVVAALSANHLAALLFPATLRRLYVARDNDAAGDAAFTALAERAQAVGIETLSLSPALQDFNDDLRHLGLTELRAALRVQLTPDDVPRFIAAVENTDPG
ncbi:DNA primase [Acidocella aquatica]|uniref:DNA primase n=1 Tax=Acidocella aquatica TaxID=1922313 RepID=A0ABQ6A909_9PROT|nr:toprim domain-containing protein [Acidocella aquatica]GLR68661.1 DNA primase [Acidocella aquatica]